MKYSKLIKVMLNKEALHYKRLGKCFHNIDTWSGKLIAWPLICIIVTFSHYCFAIMHFGFETFLYLFKRDQFNKNMVSLSRV